MFECTWIEFFQSFQAVSVIYNTIDFVSFYLTVGSFSYSYCIFLTKFRSYNVEEFVCIGIIDIANFNSVNTICQSQVIHVQLQESFWSLITMIEYNAAFGNFKVVNNYLTTWGVSNVYSISRFAGHRACCINNYFTSFMSIIFGFVSLNRVIFLIVCIQRHPDNIAWLEINIFIIIDVGCCIGDDIAVFVGYKQGTIEFEVGRPISLVVGTCVVLDSESVSAHAQYHSRCQSYGKYFFHSLFSS